MSSSFAPELEQRILARERLRLLALGYYIKGGVSAAFVSIFLIHFFFLLAFSFAPPSTWSPPTPSPISQSPSLLSSPSSLRTPATQSEPPVIMFRIFAAVIGVIILLGWTFGGLTVYAGRCIQKRKHKGLVYVMAGLNCVFVPYGTLLGVATFILMQSPGGREEFSGARDEAEALPTD
jgi:hypothetical protein